MQPAKMPVEKKIKSKENPSDDKLKVTDEKLKKSTYNVTTPRDYTLRSSAADIYAQRQKSAFQKTPRKVPGTSNNSKTSPMKDLLKSSPSSLSQISNTSRISTSSRISSSSKTTNKFNHSNVKARTAKDLPFVNVTVNSPVVKRKLNPDTIATNVKENSKTRDTKTEVSRSKDAPKQHKTVTRVNEIVGGRGDFDRQRSKTRTLDENEAKQLTPDKIDNNVEMMNLKQNLEAKPKAFFVHLDGDKVDVKTEKTSDEEVSYEDDFESYESDFESYHSDKSNENTSEDIGQGDIEKDESGDGKHAMDAINDLKEGKDEENMLDSGSFDLREQRSAKSKPAAMEFILETEEDKVTSLDEGFQDGSSAVSSMRTVHVDALDRPLFIDFKKSKEKKVKKRIFERMMQRAKDILSMVTLHEMSFTLFEMKPISYDLYMATFGRTNYSQVAVQTFEDGVTQEIQTDEVAMDYKWTQFPVKFSKFDIHLYDANVRRKNIISGEDYLSKFTFIFDKKLTSENSHDVNTLNEYKDNPLRILLEQKDGVGNCEMLQYETYKNKLNSDFSMNKLGRFLKKVENKVSRVLHLNANGAALGNVMKSAFPFSSGYVGITTKNVSDEKAFLKNAKITGLVLSENKSNLILTVHRKATSGVVAGKCVVCMWDVSVARSEPIKILIAIDNVAIGRFRGSTDGIFVAALDDGSMHLWDLSEVPSWRNDVANSDQHKLIEIQTEEKITPTERDREWNLKNINAGLEQLPIPFALQACAYTSSAANMNSKDADHIVGMEFVGDARMQDGGRRVVGQLCSLQRLGVLTIWTVVQEKTKTHDIGKAFWSKMRLEKSQTVSLTDHISAKEMNVNNPIFNLNAGKKRMLSRKQDKTLARDFSRPKSTDSLNDRPASVASARKLPVEKIIPHDWESGIVCSDLKIIQHNNTDIYLVAKNYGEVLSCTKSLGVFKVERLCVSFDTSSITCLEVSPHGSPYFLAATDSGTVHLYSLVDARVLLTLDCRNGSPADAIDRPQADSKGRFVSDPPRRHSHDGKETAVAARLSVSSVLWSRVNPCCVFTLSHEGALGAWELTHSDIYPKYAGGRASVACMANDGNLALITGEGAVQLHRITHHHGTIHYLELFHKYVAIL